MALASPRSGSQIAEDLPAQIFIIYESHEIKLADALKRLFEHWKIGTFYCRQDIRGLPVSETYRKFLAEKLTKSHLAITLLSSSFQWSPYCQAEAGACATRRKPMISVIIPPSTIEDVRKLSPVLEGFDVIEVSPTLPTWPPEKLIKILKSRGGPDRWETDEFVDALRLKAFEVLKLDIPVQNPHDAEENGLRNNVAVALRSVIEDHYLSSPYKEILRIWPSIDDKTSSDHKTPSLAPVSIIENIKRSLLDPDIPVTTIDSVGVSLKFSLPLLTAALEELAKDHKSGHRLVSVAQDGSRKALQITLVHMGDQAHILHALHDQIDIGNITRSFHEQWKDTLDGWSKVCTDAGIELKPPLEYCIDYIPPRIGVLVDKSILYAGRCSFPKKGDTEFHLRAGENEYFFYDKTSARGGREVEEFDDYLAVYKRPSFYGITLVPEASQWIGELENCVNKYPNIKEITVISQTCTKFGPLIKAALLRGLIANIYVQHPDSDSVLPEVASSIRAVPGRIRRMVQDRRDCGEARIYYFKHPPTYRVASIGQELLGIQMYIARPPEVGTVKAGELRLIVAKHSSKYQELKRELIEEFKNYEGVSREPDMCVSFLS
jgi:hypothetical protein